MKNQFTQIDIIGNYTIYKITLAIPFCFGWIDNVKFCLLNEAETRLYHVKNENETAYFEGKIMLKQLKTYKYYFTFDAAGRQVYENNNGACWVKTVGCPITSDNQYCLRSIYWESKTEEGL